MPDLVPIAIAKCINLLVITRENGLFLKHQVLKLIYKKSNFVNISNLYSSSKKFSEHLRKHQYYNHKQIHALHWMWWRNRNQGLRLFFRKQEWSQFTTIWLSIILSAFLGRHSLMADLIRPFQDLVFTFCHFPYKGLQTF